MLRSAFPSSNGPGTAVIHGRGAWWWCPSNTTPPGGGYWEHNPGSRERLPLAARGQKPLSPDQVATLIADAIAKNKRTVIAPASFHWLFLMNRLFPKRTEAVLCRRA